MRGEQLKPTEIIQRVLTVVMAVLAVSMMIFTVVSVSTFDRADRDFLGYKAFICLSDSMKATDFESGDLILVKETDCSTLQVGDIIAYTSQNSSNYGETVTHKIRELATTASGDPGFITYGTTTDTNDESVVAYGDVLGKYEGRLPGVGKFFQFLKTTPGYILCIFLPFMVLILLEGARSIRLFRQYKSEQMDELRAEREAAEAERQEAQRMMLELQQMQARMSGAGPPQPAGYQPAAYQQAGYQQGAYRPAANVAQPASVQPATYAPQPAAQPQPVATQPAAYAPQPTVQPQPAAPQPAPVVPPAPAYTPRASGGRARHFKQG